MKSFQWITIIVLVLSVFVALVWEPQQIPQLKLNNTKTATQDGPFNASFELLSSRGKVNLEHYRGKFLLIYFGYTWCPDVCPTNLAIMGSVFSQLTPAELKLVQGLFITLDPKRDTLERLAQYTPYFHPNIEGLTADEAVIQQIAKRYGVRYAKAYFKEKSKMQYSIAHSSQTFLIGRKGELIQRFEHATPASVIVSRLRELFTNKTY